MIRLALAATLSSVYGIYNGSELCEATPIPGKEEYLNSEKYEYKVWDWDRPGNIKDFVTKVNKIRRENPALHELDNLRFYPADDDNILFYGKMTPDRSNMVFMVVNLDPFDPHVAELDFPLEEMGLKSGETFQVEELLTGRKHLWRSAKQGSSSSRTSIRSKSIASGLGRRSIIAARASRPAHPERPGLAGVHRKAPSS